MTTHIAFAQVGESDVEGEAGTFVKMAFSGYKEAINVAMTCYQRIPDAKSVEIYTSEGQIFKSEQKTEIVRVR